MTQEVNGGGFVDDVTSATHAQIHWCESVDTAVKIALMLLCSQRDPKTIYSDNTSTIWWYSTTLLLPQSVQSVTPKNGNRYLFTVS